jgi:hypothetical protein
VEVDTAAAAIGAARAPVEGAGAPKLANRVPALVQKRWGWLHQTWRPLAHQCLLMVLDALFVCEMRFGGRLMSVGPSPRVAIA